jgi:hypothetical protein
MTSPKPRDMIDTMNRNNATERQILAALIVENPELGVNLHAAIRDRKARERVMAEPK